MDYYRVFQTKELVTRYFPVDIAETIGDEGGAELARALDGAAERMATFMAPVVAQLAVELTAVDRARIRRLRWTPVDGGMFLAGEIDAGRYLTALNEDVVGEPF